MKRITLSASCLLIVALTGCDDEVKVVEKDVLVTNT